MATIKAGTYKFNHTLTFFESFFTTGVINFYFGTTSCVGITAYGGDAPSVVYNYDRGDSETVYNNGWVSTDYQTITVLNDTEITDTLFSDWFTDNTVLTNEEAQTPVAYIKYENFIRAILFSGQTATLPCAGKLMRDDVIVEIESNISGGTGEEPVLIEKTITNNGTYNASDENADGYSKVVVNVPSSGGSTDCDGCIIEVEELPTENIDKDVLYMIKGQSICVDAALGALIPSFRAAMEADGIPFDVINVDELPTENIMETIEGVQTYIYYVRNNNKLYAYENGTWLSYSDNPDFPVTPIMGKSSDLYCKWVEEFKDVLLSYNGTVISYINMMASEGITFGLYYAKTRPTDNIEISTEGMMHLYYVEDEDDVLAYGDFEESGTNAWMSLTEGESFPYGGAITDQSQVTAELTLYALVKNDWEKYALPTPLKLQNKIATSNGDYTADEGYDGLSKVVVDVPIPEDYVKPNGVVQQYTVCTEEGVKSGDFIEKVNVLGRVELAISQPWLTIYTTCKLDDDRLILIGYSTDTEQVVAVVVSASVNGYTYGQPVVLGNKQHRVNETEIKKIRNNAVLVAYAEGGSGGFNISTVVLTVNGLEISMGALTTVTTIYRGYDVNLTYLQDDKLLITYTDVSQNIDEYCYVSARVLTINGTVISVGQKYTILLGISYGSALTVGLDCTKAFLVYHDPLNDRQSCCIVTVDGTVISFVNQQEFPLTIEYTVIFERLDNNTIVCIRGLNTEGDNPNIVYRQIRLDLIKTNDGITVGDGVDLFTVHDYYSIRLKRLYGSKFLCWAATFNSKGVYYTFDTSATNFAPNKLECVENNPISPNLFDYALTHMEYFDKTGAHFFRNGSDGNNQYVANGVITDTKIIFNKEKETLVIPATSNSKNVGIAITDAAKGKLVDGVFC